MVSPRAAERARAASMAVASTAAAVTGNTGATHASRGHPREGLPRFDGEQVPCVTRRKYHVDSNSHI